MLQKIVSWTLALSLLGPAVATAHAEAVCEQFQLQAYREQYTNPAQCWSAESGMRGASRDCCNRAFGVGGGVGVATDGHNSIPPGRPQKPPASPKHTSRTVDSSMPPIGLLADIPDREIGQIFQASRALIEHYLNWSFRADANVSLPVSTRIQKALSEVTLLRKDRSLNVQLRNAEYYLHGLYAAVSGDLSHLVLTYGAAIYDEMKSSETLRNLMRTDADSPNSPPGGAAWARMGLQDGEQIPDVETLGRLNGHGLPLQSLYP